MKYIIDLDLVKGDLRLVRGVEYILLGSSNIVVSTSNEIMKPTHRAYQNGTTEVLFNPKLQDEGIPLWIFYEDQIIEISVVYNEFVLANHQDDITPGFVNEEYPLFKKFIHYYFKYLGMDFNPSGFIHSLEKFADIDQTFGDFKNEIFNEVLSQLGDTKASKEILSKYILDFYSRRGTEDSIRFLIRILFNEDVLINRRRDHVLIASDKNQGKLSNADIVLQGNYLNQLHSYVLKLKGIDFWEYDKVLKTLVNPSGYLPFGENIRDPIEINIPSVNYDIRPSKEFGNVPIAPGGQLPVMFLDFANDYAFVESKQYRLLQESLVELGGTFLRGSDATYFDKNGVLQTAGPNVLRLTHDPVTGKSLGYLPEGSRERPSLSPMDLGSANWTTSPDLSFTEVPDERWGRIWKLTNTTGAPVQFVRQRNVIGGQVGTPATLCMIVKQAPGVGNAELQLSSRIDGDIGLRRVLYNPAARIITEAVSWDPNDPILGYGVIDLGDGWDLVWVSHSNGGSADHDLVVRDFANTAQDVALLAAVWAEYGEFPSSVIPGESASIRNADTLSFNCISPSEFTLVIEGRTSPGHDGGYQSAFQWDDGSNDNRLLLQYRLSDGRFLPSVIIESSQSSFGVTTGIGPSTDYRAVISIKQGSWAMSVKGSPAAVVEDATPLPELSTLFVGRSRSGASNYGPVARATIYDKAYSPIEIEGMSAL